MIKLKIKKLISVITIIFFFIHTLTFKLLIQSNYIMYSIVKKERFIYIKSRQEFVCFLLLLFYHSFFPFNNSFMYPIRQLGARINA